MDTWKPFDLPLSSFSPSFCPLSQFVIPPLSLFTLPLTLSFPTLSIASCFSPSLSLLTLSSHPLPHSLLPPSPSLSLSAPSSLIPHSPSLLSFHLHSLFFTLSCTLSFHPHPHFLFPPSSHSLFPSVSRDDIKSAEKILNILVHILYATDCSPVRVRLLVLLNKVCPAHTHARTHTHKFKCERKSLTHLETHA